MFWILIIGGLERNNYKQKAAQAGQGAGTRWPGTFNGFDGQVEFYLALERPDAWESAGPLPSENKIWDGLFWGQIIQSWSKFRGSNGA